MLVLGSGGLVGSALVPELTKSGYKVLEVRNRFDKDLRRQRSLSIFDKQKIKFCFFLACEGGRASFPEQLTTRYNEMIYSNVIPYLERRKIPFFFSSSSLSQNQSAFGRVKNMGEQLVSESQNGKVLRFWDVFGNERIWSDSHVLVDCIYHCVKNGIALLNVDENERRQMVHATDLATTIIHLMHEFQNLSLITDVSSGRWLTFRDLRGVVEAMRFEGKVCKVFFAGSTTTRNEMEPDRNNMYIVPGDLSQRLREVKHFHEQVLVGSLTPYVSIITTMRNDNYNEIRDRYFRSHVSMCSQVKRSRLAAELIVVEYNPLRNELPIRLMYPFVPEEAGCRLRVITIPPELHDGNVPFLEFVAKNVGARRARGEFLLFTNADDIIPYTVLSWISRGQLENGTVYRAGIFLDFYTDDLDAQSIIEVCDTGSLARTLCLRDSICPLDNNDPRLQNIKDFFIGDFSIIHRHLFMESRGYMEVPQNTHVETGHLLYINNNWHLKNVFFDDTVCHQHHDREGRPAAPLIPGHIARLHPESSDFGYNDVFLPESTTSSIYEIAYNQLSPYRLWEHDLIFLHFGVSIIKLAPGDITEYLGTRFNVSSVCHPPDSHPYNQVSPVHCRRHFIALKHRFLDFIPHFYGELPVVDDQYFTHVALLNSIAHHFNTKSPKPFTLAEVGMQESAGLWAARGGMAVRSKYNFATFALHVIGSKASLITAKQTLHHNRLLEKTLFFNKLAGSNMSAAHFFIMEVKVKLHVVQVLTNAPKENGAHIVLRVFSVPIQQAICKTLMESGWQEQINFPTGIRETKFGPVNFRTGFLWMKRGQP